MPAAKKPQIISKKPTAAHPPGKPVAKGPPKRTAPPARPMPPQQAPPSAVDPSGLPTMSGNLPQQQPGALPIPSAPPTVVPQPPQDAPVSPAQAPAQTPGPTQGAQKAMAAAASGKQNAAASDEPRPEIPQRTRDQVKTWWHETDNLTQRANALFQFREANKTLFPSRFNVADPRRGQVPTELRTGRDTRRVQLSRIFRDSMQTTALTVPDDIDFRWSPVPQADPPQNPMVPTTQSLDPVTPAFSKTLTIIERALLDEAKFTAKFQAWVQDSSVYPAAILKYNFRREFSTAYLNATPPDKDVTDAAARLETLMQSYAQKHFDENDAQFAEMLDITATLKQNARLTRWYGVDLQLVPLDAFGISEDCQDIVNIYDASFMFQDVLKTGEDILTSYPYNGTPNENGETFGVREDELTNATPWDTDNASTDPNSRNRSSRNRQNTTTRPTSSLSAGTSGKSVDVKKRKFLVREIWSKKNRTVYTVIKGMDHYADVRVPQKTSERWYPFAVLVPNRVPTEIYGAADLELKADIQARINRKRTDEEKARWLSLDRLIYNTAAIDEKEVIKLGDIPPGEARGINLGSPGAKLSDAVMTFAYKFDERAFDTSKDERDHDMMGALPVQSLGATGTANYAAEVDAATAGAAAAVKQRQGIVRREIEGLLHSLAEVLLQELTPDEARKIAGPYAFWPTIYDEVEADKVVEQAKAAAVQQVAPEVMAQASQSVLMGMPVDPTAIQAQLEQLSAPLWQAQLLQQYGTVEPVTRETVYRRLKVKVTSTLMSQMDRQSRVQSVTLMAQAVVQMTQAAQLAGIPFNPRALIKKAATLLDDTEDFDEMFPAISPLVLAAQTAQPPGGAAPGDPAAPDGGPPQAQGNQPNQASPSVKSQGATQGGGRPSPAEAAA